MKWLAKLWGKTFVTRRKYSADLVDARSDALYWESEYRRLLDRVTSMSLRLQHKDEQIANIKQRFMQVTEKLHVVPTYGYEAAETIAQLLRYIKWHEETTNEIFGGPRIFSYPFDFVPTPGSQFVNFKTVDPRAFMTANEDLSEMPTDDAVFVYLPITIPISGQVFRLLVPRKGPWDKMELPFDRAEDVVREELRSGIE